MDHEDHCPAKGDSLCDCDWEQRIRLDERAKVTLGLRDLQREMQDSSLIGKLLVPTINYVLGEAINVAQGRR